MRRTCIISLIVLAACAGGSSGTSADAGIQGKATLGPTCPVQRAGGPPCVEPYHGPVVVLQGQKTVTTFNTAVDGTFKVALSPGTYTLTSKGVMPTLRPVEVVVRAGAYTTIDLDFDSGIR